MNRDQAALVIQNAWRIFDDDRKSRMMDEYNNGLWSTYYDECCTPGEWEIDYDMYTDRPMDYEGMSQVDIEYNNEICDTYYHESSQH
jgi:hypothetical protein